MFINLPLILAFTSLVTARTFTVHNACSFTIWPAIFTDLNVGSAKPDAPTGWKAPAGSSKKFSVPNNWKAGRIWGRRDCDFSNGSGPTACLTGGCNGGLHCDPHDGTGVPPVTLAEFTLDASGGDDWYDVSVVDGWNLPVKIHPTKDCPVAECPLNLGPECPNPLKGPFESGKPIGCMSACAANLDGHPENSPNCCSGQYNTPDKCPPSGVKYYSYFKDRCPKSYAYAYDESSGTALWKCPASKKADYTITFCPSDRKTPFSDGPQVVLPVD